MSSLTIVLVEKSGALKQLCVKEYREHELYKKCGFKSAEGFAERAEWTATVDGKSYTVGLWGKIKGMAGSENQHDFPPPFDTTLAFSTYALVCKDGTTNLTVPLWEKIEEQLFGGFTDLTAESEGSSEEEEPNNLPLSKDGYAKDGFIVSDESEEEEAEEESTEDVMSELDYEDYDD